MRTATIFLIVGLVVSPSARTLEGSEPKITIVGGSVADHAVVTAALTQAASLPEPLPALMIRIRPEDDCRGNAGVFRVGVQPWEIDLCRVELFVALHELGHAWTAVNLTDEERAAYARSRGLGSWAEPETPWRERGSEDASDTIAWGLLPDPIRTFQPDGPIANRAAAFLQLTGVPSPRVQAAAAAVPAAGERHSSNLSSPCRVGSADQLLNVTEKAGAQRVTTRP